MKSGCCLRPAAEFDGKGVGQMGRNPSGQPLRAKGEDGR